MAKYIFSIRPFVASLALVSVLSVSPGLGQDKKGKTDHKHPGEETENPGSKHQHGAKAPHKHQVELPTVPAPSVSATKVPKGYYVQIVASNLDYPSSLEFDDKGNLYVAEAGEAPGDPTVKPRITRQRLAGELETVVSEGLEAPVTDLLWHNGKLYISHRGKISTWTEEEKLVDLVTGLPSLGDHHNNQMCVGPDGGIYFGQGTVTNSGVVGEDNFDMGWLKKHPYVHDEPAKDIILAAPPFKSVNPFMEGRAMTLTSAFQPFSKDSSSGTRIKGVTKAGGTILRMNSDGSGLEVYAWGLRNPYGLAWSPDGKLYASENGMDERGSRPVANDKEDIYLIKEGGWYGWPDFAGGEPVNLPKFRSKRGPAPQFLMKSHPPVERPLLQFDAHSSITQMDFSRGKYFGEGYLFVAFFGHMTPLTGETPDRHAEHRVARIDLKTGRVETFFSGMDHDGNGTAGHDHITDAKMAKEKYAGHGMPAKDNDPHKDHGKSAKEKDAEHDMHVKEKGPGPATAGDKETHKDHGTLAKGKHDAKDHKLPKVKGHQHLKQEGATPGPRRLIDVRFSPRGDALYVVDYGAMFMTPEPRSVPGTGVIWRIVSEDAELPLSP